MYIKELLAILATVLTIAAFVPYFRDIVRNKVKPHVFTWLVWSICTFTVFFAQLSAKGGVGAWPIGVSALLTSGVAVLAFLKRSDITIVRVDWIFLGMAMLALAAWYLTSDPTASVIILTVVDLCGFAPTLRKAYKDPHSESVPFYALFMLRNLVVVGALENYSVATAFFPAAIAAVCGMLIVMIWIRRYRLRIP